MANPDHVKLLSNCQIAIAQWRSDHTEQWLDLSEADLHGANLAGLNLTYADFRKADLSGANLSGAELAFAKFEDAKLVGANFSDTFMMFSDLSRANLNSAVFDGANLTDAILEECSFGSASFNKTVLTRVTLSNTASEAMLKGARLRYVRGKWGDISLLLSSLIPSATLKRFFDLHQRGKLDFIMFHVI